MASYLTTCLWASASTALVRRHCGGCAPPWWNWRCDHRPEAEILGGSTSNLGSRVCLHSLHEAIAGVVLLLVVVFSAARLMNRCCTIP